VRGDKVQLQQVLLNPIVNGMEAMSGGGGATRELVVDSARDGSSSVRVTVRDNGTGFDRGGAERLFDPFYTTKGGGMGMGLAISRSIIDRMGADLGAREHAARRRIRVHASWRRNVLTTASVLSSRAGRPFARARAAILLASCASPGRAELSQ